MLEKAITFTGFEGEEITRTYRFHLSQTDVTKLELAYPGGIQEHFNKLLSERKIADIFDMICALVLSSYGELAEDGMSFRKIRGGLKLYEEFEGSPAFDVLMMELMESEDVEENGVKVKKAINMEAFLQGITPREQKRPAEQKGAVVDAKSRFNG